MPKNDTSSEYYQLKMRIRSRMPDVDASLEKLVKGYHAALRAENASLSRANQRRLLKEILSEMVDELLVG